MEKFEETLRRALAEATGEEGISLVGNVEVPDALAAMRTAFRLGRNDALTEVSRLCGALTS